MDRDEFIEAHMKRNIDRYVAREQRKSSVPLLGAVPFTKFIVFGVRAEEAWESRSCRVEDQ